MLEFVWALDDQRPPSRFGRRSYAEFSAGLVSIVVPMKDHSWLRVGMELKRWTGHFASYLAACWDGFRRWTGHFGWHVGAGGGPS